MAISRGGGILINLMNRLLLINIMLLCCFLTSTCASELSSVKIGCIEKALSAKVVKVDNKNQRLFVATQNLTPEMLRAKLNDIRLCLKNSHWSRDWAISVFTESKYAGYKDDKNIIPLHKNNEWAKAYKIEYLNSSGSIMVDPALKPKSKP
jgi:hypothetical protein